MENAENRSDRPQLVLVLVLVLARAATTAFRCDRGERQAVPAARSVCTLEWPAGTEMEARITAELYARGARARV